MTGRHLLTALLGNPIYSTLYALVRKPALATNPKLQEIVVDFARLSSSPPMPRVDDAFCCLGTTIKKAGSQAAFRMVDFDYVVNFANAAKQAGCKRFLMVSAIGADANSAVFYSRVKGETENALGAIGFDALHIFQPSLLVGERAESRPGERLGIAAFSLAAPLLIGPMRKYRPVNVHVVALTMMHAAATDATGVVVHRAEQFASAQGIAART